MLLGLAAVAVVAGGLYLAKKYHAAKSVYVKDKPRPVTMVGWAERSSSRSKRAGLRAANEMLVR
jgi:hypothetical protein